MSHLSFSGRIYRFICPIYCLPHFSLNLPINFKKIPCGIGGVSHFIILAFCNTSLKIAFAVRMEWVKTLNTTEIINTMSRTINAMARMINMSRTLNWTWFLIMQKTIDLRNDKQGELGADLGKVKNICIFSSVPYSI